jgi:hypothetical protein
MFQHYQMGLPHSLHRYCLLGLLLVEDEAAVSGITTIIYG